MSTTPHTVIPMPEPPLVPVAGGDRFFPVRRIFCVGRNYAEHAKEMGFTGKEPPFFFMKPRDAILPVADGQSGEMRYPLGTKDLHHELELVVAIGSGGERIDAAKAKDHVFGYAVGLDMTRRDLQTDMKKQGRPWEIGKSFDQSAPIGPIHPIAKTGWLDDGAITLNVNGQVRQTSRLSQMIWNVADTIAYLSQYWALAPGDLIYTGTPEGVAAVVRGDQLEGHIDGLGSLRVTVV